MSHLRYDNYFQRLLVIRLKLHTSKLALKIRSCVTYMSHLRYDDYIGHMPL